MAVSATRVPARLTASRVFVPRPALTLYGAPLAFDVSCFAALGLGAWTFADGLLPATVDGRSATAYWSAGAAGALLVLLSLVLHEAGHCLLARRAGVGARRVAVSLFGGVTELDGDPAPALELRIALAGPAASLVGAAAAAIAHVLFVELDGDPLGASVLAAVAVVNLGLALVNLLPAWPLDGGRALRAVIALAAGSPAVATRVARALGRWLGRGLIVLAVIASAAGDVPAALWASLTGLVLTLDSA